MTRNKKRLQENVLKKTKVNETNSTIITRLLHTHTKTACMESLRKMQKPSRL